MGTTITHYAESHFEGLKALWLEIFPGDPPWNHADVAIPAKLAIQPELFLVALDEDEVVGSIMAGYDGHRGWLYAVAVSNTHQRRGIGTALVREAELRLAALGCHKINLQIRASNSAVGAFYEHLGYGTEDRISMGKRILAS
ncbi:MAG TPA: GNAT family acetyltransferase [Rhizomicrobium sp.]|nr:GNAT family acetyltransferase [Rhizomicrobium sp.]